MHKGSRSSGNMVCRGNVVPTKSLKKNNLLEFEQITTKQMHANHHKVCFFGAIILLHYTFRRRFGCSAHSGCANEIFASGFH